jgi:quercetin dioxygenase-like cupin family protein
MKVDSPQLRLSPNSTLTVRHADADVLEVEARYDPGGGPPPAHYHPAQDERFEVVEGEMHVRVEGDERVLRTGDTLEIPRGTVHEMWNAGSEPARLVWQTTPAGRTLEWFRTLDALLSGEVAPSAGADLLTEYADVFRLARG